MSIKVQSFTNAVFVLLLLVLVYAAREVKEDTPIPTATTRSTEVTHDHH